MVLLPQSEAVECVLTENKGAHNKLHCYTETYEQDTDTDTREYRLAERGRARRSWQEVSNKRRVNEKDFSGICRHVSSLTPRVI